MEFIKKMKKREFIEMSFKTLIAVCACFVAIILMCGMIYSIGVKSFMKYGKNSVTTQNETIAYCIEVEEDKYFVLFYNPNAKKPDPITKKVDKNASTLSANQITDTNLHTKQECEELLARHAVKEVKFEAPPASIVLDEFVEGWHIAIVAVVVAGILGYFVYRFIKLAKDYSQVEKEFKETGAISIENM